MEKPSCSKQHLRTKRFAPAAKWLYFFEGSFGPDNSFEYFMLFMVAVTFDQVFSFTGALVRGDNLGALDDALSQDSKAARINSIVGELRWRRIVCRWRYLSKTVN